MTENVPVRTSGCDLCLFEKMEQYEMDYLDKRSTVKEIIKALEEEEHIECNTYKFYNHIKHHLNPQVVLAYSKNADLLANEIIDKKAEMINQIDTIIGKLQAIEGSINADAEPAMIKAYTGMISEFRRLILDEAKLEGEVKGSQHVHVQNLSIEFNKFSERIMQDVCQNCKIKLTKTLAPILKKVTTTFD